MPTIDRLVIDLEARNAKLSKDLRKATRSMKSWQSSATKSLDSIKTKALGLGAAFAGALTIGAFDQWITSSVDAAEQIGKLATQTGLTTTKIQELDYAMNIAGVSSEENAAMLRDYAIKVGELRQGQGALKGIMEKNHGVFLQQLQDTTNLDDAYEVMIAGLADIEDPAERAAIANAAFGSSGVKLLPVLAQGATGFQQLKKDAHAFGTIIETETIKAAEDLKDEMFKMNKQLEQSSTTLAVQVAPIWVGLKQVFYDAALAGGRWINSMREADGLTTGQIQDEIGELGESIENLKTKLIDGSEGLKSNIRSSLRAEVARLEELKAELAGREGGGAGAGPDPLNPKPDGGTGEGGGPTDEASIIPVDSMADQLGAAADRLLPLATTLGKNLTDALANEPVKTMNKTWAGAVPAISKNLSAFSGELSKRSKTFRKITKIAALGTAIVSTAAGISRAFAEHIFPYSVAVAASVGAAGFAQIAAIKAQQAHGGLDYVPSESTFLLAQGERVLQPKANEDLTSYLAAKRRGEGVGGGITFNINAVDGESVERLFTENREAIMDAVRQAQFEMGESSHG